MLARTGVADGVNGLVVLDVTDAGFPTDARHVPTANPAIAVAVSDGVAYVVDRDDVDGSSALRLVDVAPAAAAMEIGSVPGATPLFDVAARNGHAYVAAGTGGLRVVDTSDPTMPHEVGSAPSAVAERVAVGEGLAHLVDGLLRTVDVSDPSSPMEIAGQGFGGGPTGLALDGDRLAVSGLGPLARNPAVAVFDASSGIPSVRSTIPEAFGPVAFRGSYLHASGSVFDVADLAAPKPAGSISLAGTPVAASGDRFYVAAGAQGFFLLRHTPGDTDSDGVLDDGDGSGAVGDGRCTSGATGCDDNCRRVENPDQGDADHDGVGDACGCDPAGCDDGDPCTLERCEIQVGCFSVLPSGLALVTCAFERALGTPACDGERVPRRIFRLYDRAARLAKRAARVEGTPRATRRLGRVVRRLDATRAAVDHARARRNPPITEECAEALRTSIDDARLRARAAGG